MSMSPGVPERGWRHTREHLHQNLVFFLEALKTAMIDMWYLHRKYKSLSFQVDGRICGVDVSQGPTGRLLFDITMKTVNELCKEGLFKRFARSNFMAWTVAQVCELCEQLG